MLKMILCRRLFLAGFKVEKYDTKDFKTMCALIKQKFPVYNEAIEIHKDIKLIDENGKFIGRYSASEARKKASTLKKDIVLLNEASNPAICKVYNFRESILKKFFDEIVNKRNEQLIRKAVSSKQLKISINLTQNQMQIKAKQIIELAKKNLNVRIFSICKQSQKDVALSKFDYVKSLIQNKCIVERDIKAEEYVPKEDEDFDYDKEKKNQEPNVSVSMVVKSKENEFMTLLSESSTKDPDQAIEIFLKRYYRQEDVEMKDLKATQYSQQLQSFAENVLIMPTEAKSKKTQVDKKQAGSTIQRRSAKTVPLQKLDEQWKHQFSYVEREARARILNERLKRILEISE